MQAFIRVPGSDGSFGYVPYDGSALTCDQENAVIAPLSEAAQQALVQTAQPTLAPGFSSYKVRDCGAVVTPPVTNQVYGYPRTRLGMHNGAVVNQGTNLDFLLEVYSSNPDQFAPKGVNLPGIVLDAGAVIPDGVQTDFYGQSPPNGFVKPAGYRLRYFGNSADQKYYEQSDLPDEPEPTTDTGTDGGSGGGSVDTGGSGGTQNYDTEGELGGTYTTV